ncbi:unnamed protein product [Paramecium octaurelia]|uniref:Uncharacterized protein n=1 Tax=Paramecium octaurelia TaxID=43137 RepID=A0A8S1X4T3_PAROT|nr:unnamed protein product [Paramecium octaurelia]
MEQMSFSQYMNLNLMKSLNQKFAFQLRFQGKVFNFGICSQRKESFNNYSNQHHAISGIILMFYINSIDQLSQITTYFKQIEDENQLTYACWGLNYLIDNDDNQQDFFNSTNSYSKINSITKFTK